MNKLFQELQRRNVIKSAISYVALSWVLLEASSIIFPVLGIAEDHRKYVLIVLIIGFPLWVIFAYVFEWTPSGFRKTDDVKPDKSIAVLPFTNMSKDPDQEYFSDGLTDDILTQLAKIDEFHVISRTSVMQFKDNPPPSSEIARKLNVELILEGSVQKAGDQLN